MKKNSDTIATLPLRVIIVLLSSDGMVACFKVLGNVWSFGKVWVCDEI